MDELNVSSDELVQIARLAVTGKVDDARLYVARLARKYRAQNAQLSQQLETFLRSDPTRGANPAPPNPMRPFRFDAGQPQSESSTPPPVDQDSRLSLLKTFPLGEVDQPLLGPGVLRQMELLLDERRSRELLAKAGLAPTRSAIFVGKPGVGKTLSARWLASKLNLQLFVLDLSTVMSSYLGRSGSNLRAAIEFAKRSPCVLLLDEIDSIAKKRGDESDIGELKRLVTVVLQEVDEWPDSSLLLAATNHPELIDAALWRRFDAVVQFELPDLDGVKEALRRYLASAADDFAPWIEILALVLLGNSFSDIEKVALAFRRSLAMGTGTSRSLVEDFIGSRSIELPHDQRIVLATALEQKGLLSQQRIATLTSVSRDTIRKRVAGATPRKKGRPKS